MILKQISIRCGSRGAYYELIHLNKDVRLQFNKYVSSSICSTVWGQIIMDAIIDPPKQGEPSFQLYQIEKFDVLNQLKQKAKLITKVLNSIEGIHCNPVMGFVCLFSETKNPYFFILKRAMYAFPRIDLPVKSIEYAKQVNIEGDVFYCCQLLEQTGICVVPGSGFKQKANTYHFRITILSPIEQMKMILDKLRVFHLNFLETWK